MASRASRRRRGGGNEDECTLYDMANKMRQCGVTKNAVPTIPKIINGTDINTYVGRMCLLQVKEPRDNLFSRKYATNFP